MARRLPAAQRRAGLVEVALQIFGADGYQATTMDAVAAAAGVTKPVLYQHFSSKHDLFLELLGTVASRLTETVVDAVSAASSPFEQVQLGFRAYFQFVSDRPAEFHLLFGEGVRSDEAFAAQVQSVEAAIAGTISELIVIEGLTSAERLVLAHGVVGLAEATGRHWSREGNTSPDIIATQITDLAWRGLRGAT